MAKETRYIEVDPHKVEETIEKWQNFGWELVGAPQEIYNKTVRDGDSYTDSQGTTTTKIITEKEHYVKICFQRDKEMPNYAELVTLEETYNGVFSKPSKPVEPVYDKKIEDPFPVFSLIFAIIGFALSFVGIFFIAVGVLFTVITIVKVVKRRSFNEYLRKEHEKEMEAYRKKEEEYPEKLKKYEEAVTRKKEAYSRAQSLLK